MRKIFAFARMALAAGVLAGCSEQPFFVPAEDTGTFGGAWDGAPWNGRSYAVLRNDTMTVVAHRKDPGTYYDEYVQVRVAFTGPGTYAVPESAGKLMKVVGGDAGWFPPASGTLVIHAYDASAHTVQGEVVLRADSFQPAWNVAGSFYAPVYPSFDQVPPAR